MKKLKLLINHSFLAISSELIILAKQMTPQNDSFIPAVIVMYDACITSADEGHQRSKGHEKRGIIET